MSALTNYQTILGSDGKPAFVVLPYADFVKLPGAVTPGTIPNAVVGRRLWMKSVCCKPGANT